MDENQTLEFLRQVGNLCGRRFEANLLEDALQKLAPEFKKRESSQHFGFRQFNEILLLCNERIVSKDFFTFLAGGKSSVSFAEFPVKVCEFLKLAMLAFGSFRFAYNHLGHGVDTEKEFTHWVDDPKELDKKFRERESPLRDIVNIAEEHLHYLGYLTEDEDERTKAQVRLVGQRNFETYLTYDFLDVYVATSMRRKWEFRDVNRLCAHVFKNRKLSHMKIRYFDPTLSFHENSIAKGLIEGLMLKRAKCTLYLAQETDTMGKDSEMASTLAQGKPVVAFIPEINVSRRTKELGAARLEELLERADFLKKYVSSDKLTDFRKITDRIAKISQEAGLDEVKERQLLQKQRSGYEDFVKTVAELEATFFNKRASVLKFNHPLRFQIDLSTGVANGVLVARTASQCADLIYRVLANRLEFDIVPPGQKISDEEKEIDYLNYRLVEKISGCAFRVVTQDEMLTNSFWNLYKLRDHRDG